MVEDKRLEIVSKNRAGDRALQQHLKDQKKQPMRVRSAKKLFFDEEIKKDPFVIVIRPKKSIMRLPLSTFVSEIEGALELNGALAGQDFEVVVYE